MGRWCIGASSAEGSELTGAAVTLLLWGREACFALFLSVPRGDPFSLRVEQR